VGAAGLTNARQLKGAGGVITTVTLTPESALVRIPAAAAGSLRDGVKQSSKAESGGVVQETVVGAGAGAEVRRAAATALQAAQASEFTDWRSRRQAAQQEAALAVLARVVEQQSQQQQPPQQQEQQQQPSEKVHAPAGKGGGLKAGGARKSIRAGQL